jgi:hypothetical protein
MPHSFQVPRSYNVSAPRPRKRASRAGCHCPTGARSVSTRGRGRGFVCQSSTPKTFHKRGRRFRIKKPFVRAVGC